MKEQISELMDGELPEREAAAPLAALRGDGEASEAWRLYHLIGDAVRGSRALPGDFTTRVAERLAREPTVLAPGRAPGMAQRALRVAMYAAAGIAGIALVVNLAVEPPQAPAPVAQAPQKPVAPKVAAQAPLPLPLAADDYLRAHQLYSPRGDLQGVAPYVRMVSEENVAGGR